MSSFSTETQGSNTFLVYKLLPGDQLDTMPLGMLTNNRIPGLASTMFTQMDEDKFLKYAISAKVSASNIFTGAVNKSRLLGIFSGIVDAMLSAEDYMIDPRTILLDLEHIYADVSTWETVLICLPIVKTEEESVDLGLFFKNIMFSTQFDSTENCDYVARIMNHLNSMPVFSLSDFKAVLDELKRETSDAGAVAVQANIPAATQAQGAQTQAMRFAGYPGAASGNGGVQPSVPSQGTAQGTPQPAVPRTQQTIAQSQSAAQPQVPQRSTSVTAPQAAPQMQVPFSGNASVQNTAGGEEESREDISLFYLLQHYNKDNAAAYKAQKERKKEAGKKGSGKKEKPPKPEKESKKKEKEKNGSRGVSQPAASFAVPGAPGPDTFAVPNMPVPSGAQATAMNPGRGASNPSCPTAPASNASAPAASAPAAGAYTPNQMNSYAQNASPHPVTAGTGSVSPELSINPAGGGSMQPGMVQNGGINFGQTTDLSALSVGQTVDLRALGQTMQQTSPHLVRLKSQEMISIDKPVFRIGKERSYVDYFIGDNTAISRSHANILCRDGEYYVVDTNSTNHTYVNGGMIQSNTETKLFHGTKIRFANEEFEFRLY